MTNEESEIPGLLIQNRDIAVPGDVIVDSIELLPGHGTYRDGNQIIASRLGVVNAFKTIVNVVPLSGRYRPQCDDIIIAKITDVLLSGWRLDFGSAYTGMVNMKDATSQFIPRGADLTQYFNIGDYVIAKIFNVTSQMLIDLTMKGPGLRALKGGRIIHVSATKVPRIIGKEGSMVSLVKNATNCNIIVGQNGWIWLSGDPQNEMLAENAIRKIEQESHKPGLTDTISQWLEEQKTGGQKNE